jgi:glycosyltransferase involved in cell wall biosynthesis
MTRSLRIAHLIQLAPKKLGSMEDAIVCLVEEAAQRRHRMDVFTYPPVHPVISARIQAEGGRWSNVGELLEHPFKSIRRLAADYDVLVLNLFAPRSRMARIAYAAVPARVAYIDNFSEMPGDSRERSPIGKLLDPFTMVRTSALIAVSDYVLRRDMNRFNVGPPFARVIYNGVDTARFKPSADAESGPPTALAVASLIPEKGLHFLIEAFADAEVPAARLQIVGEGPQRGALEELARTRKVESQVSFLGLRDDVEVLLRSAHVFVHPCLWEEAFGYTLAEAAASGCPVVASRIGATPELVSDGETGVLVPPADVRALAGAIRSVLTDNELRTRLSRNARRRAEDLFSLKKSTENHIACYEEVGG